MNDTDRWRELQARTLMHTVTFRYPRAFRKAVANSLGRIGETATLSETEEFIRECVRLNIESLMDEHLKRKSTLKVRIRRRKT